MSDIITKEERDALLRAWPWPQEAATTENGFADVVIAVERILAARQATSLANIAEARAEAEAALAQRNEWMARAVDRGQLIIDIREGIEDVLERTEWNDWPGQRRLEDRVRGALLYTKVSP